MIKLFEYFYVRPDALSVWADPVVRERLSWYYSVMKNEKPAKFIIAKSIEVDVDPYDKTVSLEELWEKHAKYQEVFRKILREVKEGKYELGGISAPKHSFLDIKISIAYRLYSPCRLCARRCGAERSKDRRGVCGVGGECIVHSYFHHLGEEAPLVPSGTIFYGGCPLKCVFCQNWDISQAYIDRGEKVSPRELAEIQKELRLGGARNINHVGGDPIPHIPFILESFKYLDINVPQLWNSNMYMTREALLLLLDVIDIWLPDLKYGNNKCAERYSLVKNYWDIVTENIKYAYNNGDMIIRHLILPGHIHCCTEKILKWIAKNTPRALVNIMDQYRPEYLVEKYPERYREIARRIRKEELLEAYRLADELGIVYRPIS